METYYAKKGRNYEDSPEIRFAREREAAGEGEAEQVDAGFVAAGRDTEVS
jgi:hypothetical protein